MRIVACSLVVLSMLLPSLASSQNCVEPPFTESYLFGGSLTDVGSGPDCRLEARLSGPANGAAIVHTVRRDASEPLILNFQVDLSQLAGQNILQTVSLASAVSKTIVGEGSDAAADLFRIHVGGNPAGTNKILFVQAACARCEGNHFTSPIPLTSTHPFVRIELDIGTASEGELRVWVDTDANEPPTLVLADLNNSAWAGVDRLSVGLSSPTPQFLSSFANAAVFFSQIGIGDNQYFYSGFEAEGIACEGIPFIGNATITGNTCDGGNLFPTLASGSTVARSTENIYTFSIPPEGSKGGIQVMSTIPVMSAFVCSAMCGPAARCFGGASSGLPFLWTDLEAGDYRLIVKTSGATGSCGEYALTSYGPMD